MSDMLRPTWVEINLDNLAFNLRSIKKFIGNKVEIMAMVKADAYGHSAIECSLKLQQEGIEWFGVALPEEGVELRQNGISKNILCLGSFWKGQENLLLKNNLTPVIYQLEKAVLLNRTAAERKTVANIHVKIDTGMGRVGVRFDEIKEFAYALRKLKNLKVEGLMTHFASADNLSQNAFTNTQIERFYSAVTIFEDAGFKPKYKDLANSPGAIAHRHSHGNLVRLGGIIYGLGGDVLPIDAEKPDLKPVLSLHTRIAHLKRVPKGETLGYGRTFRTDRDSIIATIPIGYEDGYNRKLSNLSKVIVNGKFADVVGRISMDWTIIDVTDIPDVKIDDEVILIGNSDGLEIKAEELARLVETISYEITCGVNRRVWRRYVGSK